MSVSRLTLLAGALALSSASSYAQSMVLATASGPFHVRLSSVDVATGVISPLQGPLGGELRLLDCGLSSWFDRSELDDEVPRLIEFENGVKSVVLPEEGAGIVVHYQRVSDSMFGFAKIGLDGSVQVLLELPGLGSGQDVDPFDPVIAVGPDGDRVVISAAPVEFPSPSPRVFVLATGESSFDDGSRVAEILAGAATQVPGRSLTITGDGIAAVSTTHLLMTKDLDGEEPLVPFALPTSQGGTPGYVHPEITHAKGTTRILVLAGSDPTAVDLIEADLSTHLLRKISPEPTWIGGPGNSMYTSKAPLLAMTKGGKAVSFQSRVGSDWELFIVDLELPIAPPPVHITQAPTFDAYIDQMSGILTGGSRFAYFASGGYELMADVYATDATAGLGYPSKNLTATSGTPEPPFADLAQMKVQEHFAVETSMMITDDRRDARLGFQFWVVDDLTTSSMLVSGLVAPPLFAASNEDSNSVVGTFELAGVSALVRFTTEPVLGSPIPLLVVPSSITFQRAAIDPLGLATAVAVELPNGVRTIAWISLATGAIRVTPQGWFADEVRDLEFGPNGTIAYVTRDSQGMRTARTWDPVSGLTTSSAPATVAIWLH